MMATANGKNGYHGDKWKCSRQWQTKRRQFYAKQESIPVGSVLFAFLVPWGSAQHPPPNVDPPPSPRQTPPGSIRPARQIPPSPPPLQTQRHFEERKLPLLPQREQTLIVCMVYLACFGPRFLDNLLYFFSDRCI